MSKRLHKAHERRPNNFYATPYKAVAPLIPFVDAIKTFAEPSAGEADLVRHLQAFGLKCFYQGDITTGQDALKLKRTDIRSADAIITIPPHTRSIMHRLIVHLPKIAPTWLLIDSDWVFTKQAGPYLSSCTDIITMRRVKWIAGTKSTGYANAAWYRFVAGHRVGPVFHHGWGQGALDRRVRCECCKPIMAAMKVKEPA
jgi:hypothetical protein